MASETVASSSSSLNVFAIGASRNIGYYASIKLLDAGATVTFLLRNPSNFDTDETIQKYVQSGKARLVKGDALVRSDVQNVWNAATSDKPVDVLLFTLGVPPSDGSFSLRKGFLLNPADAVTRSLLNALSTMPPSLTSHIRIIFISSIGITPPSYAALPFLLKLMYRYLLHMPHEDKKGAERVLAHCAGWGWDAAVDGSEPGAEIMGEGDWKEMEGLPGEGQLKRVLILRPALYTDGRSVGEAHDAAPPQDKQPYRASDEEIGGWTISRRDVAHFIVKAILNRWEEVEGKKINIVY